jgi:hypothetical protein
MSNNGTSPCKPNCISLTFPFVQAICHIAEPVPKSPNPIGMRRMILGIENAQLEAKGRDSRMEYASVWDGGSIRLARNQLWHHGSRATGPDVPEKIGKSEFVPTSRIWNATISAS